MKEPPTRPPWNRFQHRWYRLMRRWRLRAKHSPFLLAFAGLIFAMAVAYWVYGGTQHRTIQTQREAQQHRQVLQHFSQLEAGVNHLNQQTRSWSSLLEHLLSIESALETLATRMQTLATHQDLQRLSVEWQNSKKNLPAPPEPILPLETSLPFRILSLDVMGEEPFVVVEYQQRLIPLRRLDLLASWQWLEGDSTQQRVTWRSPEGKTLTLTLSKADQ